MDGGDRWNAATRLNSRAVIESVMALRFRPIAPKPIAGEYIPGGISPQEFDTGKRAKRKYVRAQNCGGNPRRRRSNNRSEKNTVEAVQKQTIRHVARESNGRDSPASRSLRNRSETSSGRAVIAESWVTVEHVTDTCITGKIGLLGCTDSLASDTCPGFVTDASLSNVVWVNEAYRKMVAATVVVVRLATVSGGAWGCTDSVTSFTCRVRVENHVSNDDNSKNSEWRDNMIKRNNWKIIPCDVWRLESGGFAWRLDIKAALGLAL